MSKKKNKVLADCSSRMIYESRIRNDCTQYEYSELIALSPRAYENLELGKSLPQFQTLVNLSIAGGLDLNLLIDEIRSNGYTIEDERNS